MTTVKINGRPYRVARIRDLPRVDQERLVGINRRLLRLRMRPARVSRALAEMVSILVPTLEPEVVDALDNDSRRQVLELAKEISL